MNKGVVIRDLLIFQMKLVIDGVKDLVLIQLSVVAAVFDLLFSRRGRPSLFYGVMRLSERFDLWLNLNAAARNADTSEEGLFGGSEPGDGTMLGRLEEMVTGKVETTRAR
jgi:hypothetical protein